MKTLARLAIIAAVVCMAFVVAALAFTAHWILVLLCAPGVAMSIVFAGEAAADLEWSARLAVIVVRVRLNRWRWRLRKLAGGSQVAVHPYRGAGDMKLQRLRDWEGIDRELADFRAGGRALGMRSLITGLR